MEDIKKYAVKGHIPTVNEGIEEPKMLVRCKDCKYWNKIDKAMYCTRHIAIMHMTADDFCSRGERRGESNE